MFRNLLTPLTARFHTQAAPEDPVVQQVEEEALEDFERDARVEEMRATLEDIKYIQLDDITRKMQVCTLPSAPVDLILRRIRFRLWY